MQNVSPYYIRLKMYLKNCTITSIIDMNLYRTYISLNQGKVTGQNLLLWLRE